MNKRELQLEADNVVIENPCIAKWDDMEGGQTVRFCGQCSKNVHNLSAMAPDELASTLEKRKQDPTCVYMSRRENGTVVIDNCPVVLRATRDRIRGYATAALAILLWSLATGADAQVLIGAPCYHHPAVALFVPFGKTKKATINRLAMQFLALALIPVLVHLVGSFAIDKYGGLGGGM